MKIKIFIKEEELKENLIDYLLDGIDSDYNDIKLHNYIENNFTVIIEK